MIDQPVVKAEWPFFPEFDPAWDNPESRPIIRPGHGAQPELGGEPGDSFLQLKPARQRPRLLRRPGADLAGAVARGEIGVGLGRGHLLHLTLDTDLPLQGFPVEAEGGPLMGEKLLSLAALVIGVED